MTSEPRQAAIDQERPPIVCDACGGDGGFEVVDGPDHERGGAITHWSTCRACDGSGEVPDDSEPLDEMSAAERDAALAAMGEPEDSLMLGGCGGGERDPDLEWY